MRRQTHALPLALATAGLLIAVGLVAAQPQALPLVQSSDLVRGSSFTLPAGATSNNVTDLEYVIGAIAFNPARNSLFVGCHAQTSMVAEVSIPSGSGEATILQPCREALAGRIASVNPGEPNSERIGGLLVVGDRLIITVYSIYDASRTAIASHFVRSTNLSDAAVAGPFRVGSLNPGFYAGFMTPIPAEHRGALGGDLALGQCCLNIISRTSFGPAAFAAASADLVAARASTPAAPLVYYDEAHPTLGPWGQTSQTFNGTTHLGGAAMPSGTRSLLQFGQHGTGTYCYGAVPPCSDSVNRNQGNHSTQYEARVYAYDVNDLAAVKAGSRQPWDVRPYAIWPLSGLSFAVESYYGVATDTRDGTIYLVEPFGNGARPRIWRYSVRVGTPPPPPPPPGPVDCVVSAWSEWSAWSAWTAIDATTERRTRTRTRTVVTPASDGGAPCGDLSGSEAETRPIVVAPPPPPPAISLTLGATTVKTCSVTWTATAPDTRTGWTARLRVDAADVGTSDSSSPYAGSADLQAGSHQVLVRFTRGSVFSRTTLDSPTQQRTCP